MNDLLNTWNQCLIAAVCQKKNLLPNVDPKDGIIIEQIIDENFGPKIVGGITIEIVEKAVRIYQEWLYGKGDH